MFRRSLPAFAGVSGLAVASASASPDTNAAASIVRLILQNEIDPQQVGMLHTSGQNGENVQTLVNQAMTNLSMPTLRSDVTSTSGTAGGDLGGITGLKTACHYADTEAAVFQEKVAIVVSSSAETAVATLVESQPKMFSVDLKNAGSTAPFSGPEFQKPHDLIELTQAVEKLLGNFSCAPSDYFELVQAIFFHSHDGVMPAQTMSFLYARALARATSFDNTCKMEKLCAKAGVKPEEVCSELALEGKFFIEGGELNTERIFRATNALAQVVQTEEEFLSMLDAKMSVGTQTITHFGENTIAPLHCWIAAGFSDALSLPMKKRGKIAGNPMVMIGSGAGAEAIPFTPVIGWEIAARKIGVMDSNQAAVNVSSLLSQKKGQQDRREILASLGVQQQ